MQFTVKQARNHAGLTQAYMAKVLGVNRGTYSKLEKDLSLITVGQLCKISQETGIPIHDIFVPCDSTLVDSAERKENNT